MTTSHRTGRSRGDRRWTAEHDAELIRLHAAGKGLNETAREMGFASSIVSNRSSTLKPPLSWDRRRVAVANEARRVDAAEARSQLELEFAQLALANLKKAQSPYTYKFASGTIETDEPLPSDQYKFQMSATAMLTASLKIAEHQTATGIEDTKSMFARMGDALGIETYEPTGDEAEDE